MSCRAIRFGEKGENGQMKRQFNRAMWDRRVAQRGFTLIELLVVIAVLAILAVVVLFNVTGIRNKGQQAGCGTDVKTIQTAVDAYLGDQGTSGSTALSGLIGSGTSVSIWQVNPNNTTGGELKGTAALNTDGTYGTTLAPNTGFAALVYPKYIHTPTTGCTALTLAYQNQADSSQGFVIAGS
jgi:general secretion pathway protein G